MIRRSFPSRVLLAVGLSLAASAWAAQVEATPVNFKIDPAHSEVSFIIRHIFSKVSGRFSKFSGTFSYDADNPSASAVRVEVEPASIYTSQERRDNHLRSPDFFDVEKFPTLTFVSTSVKPAGKDKLEIVGDLTMHGVTKPVTLTASLLGSGAGPDGLTRAGFEAGGTLNRKDFGVSWNKTLDKGGLMLGEDVELRIGVEAVEQSAAPAAAPAPTTK